MASIILIEDNADLAEGLRVNLELEGHIVSICSDGLQAVASIVESQPDLVLLDVALPNQDGFQVLQQLRNKSISTPIMMLTARGEETDKVRALRWGADDYVTKPFGLLELIARIEALLRRSGPEVKHAGSRKALFGNVEIERATRRVWRNDVKVNLTPRETDLLFTLADQPNQVWSRQSLMKTVWGHQAEVASRTVDTHIAELRRKLEDNPNRPCYLRTARSAGYWLDLSTGSHSLDKENW
jgi:DNA-binding response OmpR family regulator